MGNSRDSQRIEVRIGGKPVNYAVVHSIEQYAGSELRDACEFEIAVVGPNDATKTGFELAKEYPNDIVQVGIKDRRGRATEWVHYGRLIGGSYQFNENGRVFGRVSRFDEQLLGSPLHEKRIGIIDYSGRPTSTVIPIDRELVFNPRYEGRVFGNMQSSGGPVPLFADLNALNLDQLFGVGYQLWTLPDVVNYLCWNLNPFQDHVDNPLPWQLRRLLPQIAMNNFSLPVGVYLGEALDRVLRPFGYYWRIKHHSANLRTIEFFHRNTSYGRFINLGGHWPGTPFDDYQDIAPIINLRVDNASNVYNAVRVIGAKLRMESTFYLEPDWVSSLEGQDLKNYIWDSPQMLSDGRLRNVYRKYKANLGILYILNRKTNAASRRPFLPCLSLDIHGQPYGAIRGVHVEYSIDGGDTWQAIAAAGKVGGIKQGMECEIVENEPAILFTGKIFPAMSLKWADRFQVRATATVELDDCLFVQVSTPSTPLNDTRELVISEPNRFQKYEVSQTSVLKNAAPLTAEIDASLEMSDFAREILNAVGASDISGTIELHGVDWVGHNMLGANIKDIPREVSLKLTAASEKYPAIVGLVWNVDDQTVKIMVGELEQ